MRRKRQGESHRLAGASCRAGLAIGPEPSHQRAGITRSCKPGYERVAELTSAQMRKGGSTFDHGERRALHHAFKPQQMSFVNYAPFSYTLRLTCGRSGSFRGHGRH